MSTEPWNRWQTPEGGRDYIDAVPVPIEEVPPVTQSGWSTDPRNPDYQPLPEKDDPKTEEIWSPSKDLSIIQGGNNPQVDAQISSVLDSIRATAQAEARAILLDAKNELQNYGKQYLQAILSGQKPPTVPDITAVDAKGKEYKVSDAKNRSLRTFLQGLGFDLLLAVGLFLTTITDVNFTDKSALILLAASFAKTIITTIGAYIMRLKFQPQLNEDGERKPAVTVPVETLVKAVKT